MLIDCFGMQTWIGDVNVDGGVWIRLFAFCLLPSLGRIAHTLILNAWIDCRSMVMYMNWEHFLRKVKPVIIPVISMQLS